MKDRILSSNIQTGTYTNRILDTHITEDSDNRLVMLRKNWMLTTVILFVGITVYLVYLVFQEQTLPVDDISTMSMIAVSFGLISIGLVKIFGRLPLFSFPIIFAGATFLYTLSGFILFPLDGWNAFRNYVVIDETGIQQGLPIVMLAFSSYLLGAFLHPFNAKMHTGENFNSEEYVSVLRGIGYIMYALSIGLIAYATIQGQGLNQSYEGGYEGFNEFRAAGLLPYTMSTTYAWFLPWSYLILMATSRSKRQIIILSILTPAAIAIYLLTGNRTIPTILLVLLIPARYLIGYPFKAWQIVFFVVLVLVIVSAWDAIRVIPVKDWSVDTLRYTIGSESFGIPSDLSSRDTTINYRTPFGWIFSNLSNSYQTLMGAIRLVPRIEPFHLGMDYLRSALNVIPFLITRSFLDLELHPTLWITYLLAPSGRSGLGFLQVGEAYINFGALGVVGLYLIMGRFLTSLWYRLDVKAADPRLLSYSLILLGSILLWIRNDSSAIGRSIVWGWLIVYAIPGIIMKLRRSV